MWPENMLARAEKLAAGCDETERRHAPTPEERERIQHGFSSLRDVLAKNARPGGRVTLPPYVEPFEVNRMKQKTNQVCP